MDHPSLEYYVEIARCLNISKAAENLHISQQSLSAYIQKLEKYYGLPLLVRKPKMKLTEAGERVLLAAEELERVYRELDQDLQLYQTRTELQVNLGIFIPLSAKAMKNLPLIELNKQFPDATIAVKTGYNHDLERRVLEGELHFGITTRGYRNGSLRKLHPDLTLRVLSQDEECIIMTDRVMRLYFADEYDAYLAKFQEGVDLLDLSHIPMIMHPMESGISQKVRQYFVDNHRTFKIFSEVPSQELVNNMVLENNAFSFCSRNIFAGFLSAHKETVWAFPLKKPSLKREILLICGKGVSKDKALSRIGELIAEAWEGGQDDPVLSFDWKG